MADERDIERTVLRQWECATLALAAVRERELRQLTDEEALRAAEELLDLVSDFPPKGNKSGLIERQRLFARGHASNHIPIDVALASPSLRGARRRPSVAVAHRRRVATDMRRRGSHRAQGVRRPRAGLVDVEGIVLRQESALDRDLIYRELLPLLALEDSAHQADRLSALFDRAS